MEVHTWPFSAILTHGRGAGNVLENYSYPGFLKDAGFGAEGLEPLMYTLAVDEPGMIYLAAINNERGPKVTKENPRGMPRLRMYYHIAVLVPWFDVDGTFQVTVFESAAETSWKKFKTRLAGQFLNLSRVPLTGDFAP
jgi:hypothetical protein